MLQLGSTQFLHCNKSIQRTAISEIPILFLQRSPAHGLTLTVHAKYDMLLLKPEVTDHSRLPKNTDSYELSAKCTLVTIIICTELFWLHIQYSWNLPENQRNSHQPGFYWEYWGNEKQWNLTSIWFGIVAAFRGPHLFWSVILTGAHLKSISRYTVSTA